ncbi:DUF3482 domain-containing protein [Allopusillimonas soli]|uniref:GTPase and DUF3482 domain-containing protein n=1 Tax=Allopusillimonas soli TaxID=659016 RepID=A0A853FHL3_9BURK|nr:DUF3482 domain-containing protein [Allopusillimonas soli]NYT37931.1 GTPase and DUF3482 domain-containing protein [Allopusillimonas soli]TEA73830.1 DUF3482 domain-containing protein [Allopusillimonas soli]
MSDAQSAAAPAVDNQALKLAVVGHTNTGKTSLLRTLARDPGFGQVQDSPGTTRHVEGASLLVDGRPAVTLYDTPGIEDSIALLDYLEQIAPAASRLDGPERIRRFLDSPEAHRRFEQEARVLRKLLDSDAGLYVVDARDPILGKHKDELTILASCGHPLLPVLNFTHSPQQRLSQWREALARLGLHAIAEFDTVAPALDGEAQLYDKLALLLDGHAALLREIRDEVAQQKSQRHKDGLRLIAELLVDAAAWRIACEPDQESVEAAAQNLRRQVRDRETACVRSLLKRYNFSQRDFPAHALPLEGERWGMDLFHPQALKDFGVHVGKGLAAGAMAGATLDVFTAGLSLGAATLLGAAVGGLWQGADKIGKRVMGRLQGYREITVDDAVLRLLALRQLALLRALERRGHAAQAPIELEAAADENTPTAPAPQAGQPAPSTRDLSPGWQSGRLPDELQEARSQPQWSTLSGNYENSSRRKQVVQALTARLSHPASGAAAQDA